MNKRLAGRAVLLLLAAVLLSSSAGCAPAATGGTTGQQQDANVSQIISQLAEASSSSEVYSQSAGEWQLYRDVCFR